MGDCLRSPTLVGILNSNNKDLVDNFIRAHLKVFDKVTIKLINFNVIKINLIISEFVLQIAMIKIAKTKSKVITYKK